MKTEKNKKKEFKFNLVSLEKDKLSEKELKHAAGIGNLGCSCTAISGDLSGPTHSGLR
jgi:hypothetical protein